MEEKVLCKNCVYGFDEVGDNGMTHCCRHKKSMHNEDSCEDGREI